MMTSAAPVEATHSSVRQTVVTGDVDLIGISFKLRGAVSAAGIGDVTIQRCHDGI